MSLDTVLNIGKNFRKSPAGWRYHRFVKSVDDEIEIYNRNKDASGNSIETVIYQLPVKGNAEIGFEFDFDKMVILTDESKIKSLLYLNFKTSDKDKEKKYLFGDIVYCRFKDKKGKLNEYGNYRLRLNATSRHGSFERCKDLAINLENTVIGKFRTCFESNLEKIENDILRKHPAVVIHFAFDDGKIWLELDGVEELIKTKLLNAFVVEVKLDNRRVYALNKTLFKTIKPPIWDNESKTFKDPDGIGGVTPCFENRNTFKLRAFDSPDDVWDLMFAIDFTERPLISIFKNIGIIALPKGNNLPANQLLNFLKKAQSLEQKSEDEDFLGISNKMPDERSTEFNLDSLFAPFIDNTFDDEVKFDVIFLKPKAGSSPAVDLIEISSISKSHLKNVHDKILKIKLRLEDELNSIFPKAKKHFYFNLKENFKEIFTNKTKAEKKYQFHLLKVLPQIYLDAYYEDPLLLPAFIERTEYNIRNEAKFIYNWFRFNFLFLSNIQKNNPIMNIVNSQSYAIGRSLGLMSRPFAAWRDDCPIKSFEKNYVGNLTRRIAYPEDVVKFSNFLNEKLAIHEKLYKDQQEASRLLTQELKAIGNMRYNKNECALGFFEAYFENQESSKTSTIKEKE